jgi:hypothetical protein
MKQTLLVIIIISLLSCNKLTPPNSSNNNPTLPNNIPLNGLLGYYPFTGNANDYSGNGNNGSVNGVSLTTDRFGNANSAYSFNGISNNISIGSLKELNVLQYTITGWFQKSSNSINQEGTIVCGDNPCNTPGGLRFAIGTTNQAFWLSEFQSCSENGVITTNQNYADDQWHYFAVTFNSNTGLITSSSFKIYIDTNLVLQTQESGGNLNNVIAPINNQNLPTIIGSVTGGSFFKGKLDDIGIWNRVLTSTEIRQLYTPGSLLFNYIPSNGLLAYYPFNGNANDVSSNMDNGVVNGSTLTTDRFGNINSAYNFSNTDYIEVPTSSGIFNSQTYTYSFWIKDSTSSPLPYAAFISRLNTTGNVYNNFCLFTANGNVNLNYLSTNGNMLTSANNGNDGPNVLGNVWKYVVISVGTDSIRSYLNGSLVHEEAFIAGGYNTNTIPIRFGLSQNPYWLGFTGELDDIGIWNRVLTQSEITQLYNAPN